MDHISLIFLQITFYLAGVEGFEPPNVGVRVRCLTAWRYPIKDFYWQGWQDLNLRMPESKSGALPLGDTPILYRTLMNKYLLICYNYVFNLLNFKIYENCNHKLKTLLII